jgi:Xaa-Pro aminopeptidase
MVHTVEPGMYMDGMGGIRLEENVIVTADGCEVMGPCGNDMGHAT